VLATFYALRHLPATSDLETDRALAVGELPAFSHGRQMKSFSTAKLFEPRPIPDRLAALDSLDVFGLALAKSPQFRRGKGMPLGEQTRGDDL
jgi:hypothetical protein